MQLKLPVILILTRNVLKLDRLINYHMCVRDSDDPNCIIDDSVIIKETLTNYWPNLGKSNRPTDTNLVENLQQLEHGPCSQDSLHSYTMDIKSIESVIILTKIMI